MKNFFQTFKEELIAVPLLILLFFGVNWQLGKWFPNSEFFDFVGQMETFTYRLMAFVVTLVFAWVGVRITFPQVYNYLREDFYHKFADMDDDKKTKYAVIIIAIFILCATFAGSARAANPNEIRTKLVNQLESQLYIRETSYNSSIEIDMFLQSVNVLTPAAWCGAYVGYNLGSFNVPNPQSAWSPDYAKPKDVIWTPKKCSKDPLPGDVFTLYYTSLKRVGHTGFFIKKNKDGYAITIEGNTNGDGSREGDGVYKKKRDMLKLHAITRYIK